jgi:hypothetical protein
MVIGGVFLESLIMKLHFYITKKHYKEHHYAFGKYVFFLSFPLLALLVIFYLTGQTTINVFLIFSFFGTILEWCIGYAYYQVVGQRLWTYHRYSIGSFTSFLSIPVWGLGGVMFWLLAKVFV